MNYMMSAGETDQSPSAGMAPDFYDQPPFETGVDTQSVSNHQQHQQQQCHQAAPSMAQSQDGGGISDLSLSHSRSVMEN